MDDEALPDVVDGRVTVAMPSTDTPPTPIVTATLTVTTAPVLFFLAGSLPPGLPVAGSIPPIRRLAMVIPSGLQFLDPRSQLREALRLREKSEHRDVCGDAESA